MLPTRYDHGEPTLWQNQASFFFPLGCISPSIHTWKAMDTSPYCRCHIIPFHAHLTSEGDQNCRSNLHHALRHSRASSQAVCKLPWMGFGLYWLSHGPSDEAILPCLQLVRR